MQVEAIQNHRQSAPVLAKLVVDAVLEHVRQTGESVNALSIRIFGGEDDKRRRRIQKIVDAVRSDPETVIKSDTAEVILREIGKKIAVVDADPKAPGQ